MIAQLLALKMKEIVSIQMGHCGSKIGEKFWQTICNEHNISRCGHFYGDNILPYQYLNVYFELAQSHRYVPRTILCDLDYSHINEINNGPIGELFNPDYTVRGAYATGNNFAKGFITDGAPLVDEALEITRKQVERCESIQGFQMSHSIGGGTGSGVGSLMLQNLRDEFPDQIINTFTVIPSARISDVVTEPYNAVLCLSEMIDTTNESIIFDNEAILDICCNQYRMKNPIMEDLNALIANTMSGVTTGFRFPGQLNTDLRKIMTNMCPYPRMKFFIPGYSPIRRSNNNNCDPPVNVRDLVEQIFDPEFQMISDKMQDGRYLTCATIFRGNVSSKEVEEATAEIQKRKRHMFVNWIPNNVKSAICDVPPLNTQLSATFLANTSATACIFGRLLHQFDALFDKKAFLHWYLSEGMDEHEFECAKDSVLELCDAYIESANDDDSEDESEDENTECDCLVTSTSECSNVGDR